MAKVTQHLQVTFTVKEIEKGLDALALDDWKVISVFPLVANAAEMGENAPLLCVLSREVNP